jgi:hypothetical protein
MEADWDVEIGRDVPSIVVPWEGFFDLRGGPCTTAQIPEVVSHPALDEALIKLNANGSPVFTSKCDVWSLEREEIDSYEFGSRPENAFSGLASYIDVLLRDPEKFLSFQFHEQLVRRITEQLRAVVLTNGRADLVARPATIHSASGFGVTVYAAGCGAEKDTAYASWESVLQAVVNATINVSLLLPPGASSSIG